MALRAAAAAPTGLRRLFSSFAFAPPPTTAANTAPPPAEPSTNLFVSGLSKRTTSEGLREAFAKFGQVVHARVVTDRVSGYSKGFGFVRYATLEEAAEGIKGMDGKFLDGWLFLRSMQDLEHHLQRMLDFLHRDVLHKVDMMNGFLPKSGVLLQILSKSTADGAWLSESQKGGIDIIIRETDSLPITGFSSVYNVPPPHPWMLPSALVLFLLLE